MIPIDRGGGGYTLQSLKFPFLNSQSRRAAMAAAIILIACAYAFADAQRGTLVHEETIRVSPNSSAARVGEALRGHELIILDTSRDWVHVRSEEHTSELQSHLNLVCRLLLE